VRNIVFDAYQRVRQMLTTHRDKLTAVARALLERETLNKEEFEAVFNAT
jgi:cell division protease FtsH